MSFSDLNHAVELIEKNIDLADFVGELNEDLIDLAEKELGLNFPPTYRAFLKKYGCGDIAGQEFYGLINSNFQSSGIPDAVWITLSERKVSQLLNTLILIGSTGDGAYYAIDCSQISYEKEHPIVTWEPGVPNTNSHLEIVYEDFGEFLFSKLKNAL
jgi:hypothetical protein